MRISLFTFLIFLSSISFAQEIPIGTWRMHLPYGSSIDLAYMGDRFASATSFSMLYYYTDDGSLQQLDKSNSLNDFGVRKIGYSAERDVLIIAYNNANIDIITNGNKVTPFTDILNANEPDLRINHIFFRGNEALLSSSIGIIVIDLDALEVKDTYRIGVNGSLSEIFQVDTFENRFFAATDQGLKSAPVDDPFLGNFNRWDQGPFNGSIEFVNNFNGDLFTIQNDTLKQIVNDTWTNINYEPFWTTVDLRSDDNGLQLSQWKDSASSIVATRILSVDASGVPAERALNIAFRPSAAIQVGSDLWISDQFAGIRRVGTSGTQLIVANSPRSSSAFGLEATAERLVVAAGGVSEDFAVTFNQNGFYIQENSFWSNYNQFSNSVLTGVYDMIDAYTDVVSGKIYLASFLSGLVEFDNGAIQVFDQNNSILEGALDDPGRTKISAVDGDANGTIYIANFGAQNPVAARLADGTFTNFALIQNRRDIIDFIIDRNGQKWFAIKNNGLVVIDDNGDPTNTGSIVQRTLGGGSGNGNLHDLKVLSIVEDNDGEIWVGTESGISIYFCSRSVLTSNGCDASRPIVSRDGVNGFLFETDKVQAMAVDGANRKWVGTPDGLFLISDDGEDEIFAFTTDNSPLPSNNITDISINPQTGEVYIATDQGLVSYRSDATAGTPTQENTVIVFPNPVEPGYEGPIAVKGLVEGAYIKITDTQGTLVFEGPANGGTITWNGYDYTGRRANTGVYLVWSSNEAGDQNNVAKFLILR